MTAKKLTEEEAYALLREYRDEGKQEDRRNRAIGHHRRGDVQMTGGKRIRIGFIPLADATALIVAVDKGFTAEEGLDVELVREVSWSNVRDKLNIGLFDAAHLLAPVAIASSLGLGHVKVPIITAFGLGLNGNAITVSPDLYAAMKDAADGDLADPMVSARALARVVMDRKARGDEPLTFGMTFPFSTHNYQLAVLDGGRRRRPRSGRAADRAAAALYGGKPRQQACRRLLCRRPVEFGRGRSRHRPHPAFRVGDPRSAPPKRCWRCAQAGPKTIRSCFASWCARMTVRRPSSRIRTIGTR